MPPFLVSPANVDLGFIPVGFSVPPIKLTISANVDIHDLTVVASGPDIAIDEATSTCTPVLLADQTCVLSVVAPTLSASAGSKDEEITISAGGPSGKVVTCPIVANVVTGGFLVIDPSSPQVLEIGAPVTFVVLNAGTAPTGTLDVSVSGPNAIEFQTTTTCTVLAPLTECKVSVLFTSTAAGQRNANLTITDTGPWASSVAVTLSGLPMPTNPNLPITSTTADLGAVLVGTTGPSTVFTLTNMGGFATGTLATVVSNPELVITSDTCAGVSVGPGGTCTVGIALKPTTAGPKSGTLTEMGTVATPAVKVITGTGTAS